MYTTNESTTSRTSLRLLVAALRDSLPCCICSHTWNAHRLAPLHTSNPRAWIRWHGYETRNNEEGSRDQVLRIFESIHPWLPGMFRNFVHPCQILVAQCCYLLQHLNLSLMPLHVEIITYCAWNQRDLNDVSPDYAAYSITLLGKVYCTSKSISHLHRLSDVRWYRQLSFEHTNPLDHDYYDWGRQKLKYGGPVTRRPVQYNYFPMDYFLQFDLTMYTNPCLAWYVQTDKESSFAVRRWAQMDPRWFRRTKKFGQNLVDMFSGTQFTPCLSFLCPENEYYE